MTEVVGKKVGPISQERIAIQRLLAEANVGDVISWEKLEALTSLPRSRVYTLVRESVRALERERMMHFATRSGVGIERIGHVTAARETLPRHRLKIARAARRTRQTAEKIDLSELNHEDRARTILEGSLASMIEHAASNKGMKQLESGADKERLLTPLTPRDCAARLFSKD